MIPMTAAMRLKGITEGSIVASRTGRDKAQMYVVMQTDDPFALCYNGRSRTWPDRPKKKRITHLLCIGATAPIWVEANMNAEQVNQWIRETLRKRKEHDG